MSRLNKMIKITNSSIISLMIREYQVMNKKAKKNLQHQIPSYLQNKLRIQLPKMTLQYPNQKVPNSYLSQYCFSESRKKPERTP
jgi:hypothetical protein